MGRNIDYSKTQMYKLCCKDLEVKPIYVGHTTNWVRRQQSHKHGSIYTDLKVYNCIRDNGGWENWEMVFIQDYPCKNKREAEKRERELIEELKAELNCNRPFVSVDENKDVIKEWYIKNKTEKLRKNKENYIKTREHVRERHKKNYQDNKQKVLERTKKYYKENRDCFVAYQHEYYKKNREKLIEQRQNRILFKKIDEMFSS
jgi:hypothetical protein